MTNHGTVSDAALATINKANLTLDGTGTLSINQITDVHGRDVQPERRAPRPTRGLPMPTAPAWKPPGAPPCAFRRWRATRAASTTRRLSRPREAAAHCCFRSWRRSRRTRPNYSSRVQIEALAGGEVELPLVTQITGGPVQLESDGAGSQLIVLGLDDLSGPYRPAVQLRRSRRPTAALSTIRTWPRSIRSTSIGDATGTFTISASLGLSITGGTSTVPVGTLLDQGNLGVQSTGTLNIEGGLSVNSSGILTTAPGSTIEISGNLLGNTQNADAYSGRGRRSFDSGTGTANPPQLLEAMSADLGARPGGFRQQFRLRDDQPDGQHVGRAGRPVGEHDQREPEAVYANELIVPAARPST